MTGLKEYERDRGLPARAGEPEACPPEDAAFLELVEHRLSVPGGPRPERAKLVYARWKPRTAITAVYAIECSGGARATVTHKRYFGDKARSIERSYAPEEHVEGARPVLKPFYVDPVAGACLYTLPADRELPGLARAYDLQRTARLVAGRFPGRIRWRRSGVELLRYKPEHRAVLRLELVLRDEREELVEARAAVRALPPLEAARIQRARAAAFAGARGALAPEVIVLEERTGLLFETWLDVATHAGDEFGHARAAGALLARLHSDVGGAPHGDVRTRVDGMELFAFDRELAERARRLAPPPVARPACWIHGDLHPDQVARRRSGGEHVLLDLDALRPGEPVEDLAAWTADALQHGAAPSIESASAELLDGYAESGGARPTDAALAHWTAQELRERAAASLRRLERGAIERARRLLELAQAAEGV